jgi:hypothetical protein
MTAYVIAVTQSPYLIMQALHEPETLGIEHRFQFRFIEKKITGIRVQALHFTSVRKSNVNCKA